MKQTLLGIGILIPIFFILSCNNSKETDAVRVENGIIDIDINKAIEDRRDFKLSQLVKDVEFITLESTVESYFEFSQRYQVTDHYILIIGEIENRILLFDRSGKFLRQIGKRGQGPGEYYNPNYAAIDPGERFIFVIEGTFPKILKFNIDGTFIKERNISSEFTSEVESQPLFLDNAHFALAFDRPIIPQDDYYNIGVFDSELILVEKMIPIPNNDSLCLKINNRRLSAGSGKNFFFENFVDTVYSIDIGQKPKAEYHFTITENRYTLDDLRGKAKNNYDREFNSVNFVTDLPYYSLITTLQISSTQMEMRQLIYDKKEMEAFLPMINSNCDTSSLYRDDYYCISNDLFGYNPVWLGAFPGQNLSIYPIYLSNASSITDLECLRKMDVLLPEKRDKLADMIESHTGEELPILVLLHYK